ncbi:glutamate receptor ionotropic, delta-1-like [Cherax quadricarinatus]|uniref:glutamate receptor ionotropic, delta-1-like n=1 Tax=Cherax quadricarinatus TaxID=27406 RepID=UPI00387EA32E
MEVTRTVTVHGLKEAAAGMMVFSMEEEVLSREETWRQSACDIYVFLMTGGDAFIRHANVSHYHASATTLEHPHALWNYNAHYILLFDSGNATLSPSDIATLYNFKKTEKVLILQQREKHLLAWTNQLYAASSSLTLLDTWRDGKFHRGKSLFPEKLNDLHGVVLRVATFDHPPSVVYVLDDHRHIVNRLGVDMQIVQVLAKSKNFSVEYVEINPDDLWGFELDNGTWVGLVGKVYYELADIGACNMFLELNRWKQVDYSTPYNFERGCFAAPSPKPLPNWKSPAMPFTWDTWSSVVVALAVSGGILHLIVAIGVSPELPAFRSLSHNYLYILGALTMHTLKTVPLHAPVRVYVGCVGLFGLIIATAYSANLVAFLSVSPMSAPIDTLDQLSRSGLRIGSHAFWKTQFDSSNEPVIRGFGKILETGVDLYSLFDEVEDGKFALIENKQYVELAIGARFTYGSYSSIRIVPECLLTYSIGLAYQKNSPLRSPFDGLILRLFESGVIYKWQSEVVAYFRAQHANKRLHAPESHTKPLNLAHLQGVFYVLGIGSLVSALILALEMSASTQQNAQHSPLPEKCFN